MQSSSLAKCACITTIKVLAASKEKRQPSGRKQGVPLMGLYSTKGQGMMADAGWLPKEETVHPALGEMQTQKDRNQTTGQEPQFPKVNHGASGFLSFVPALLMWSFQYSKSRCYFSTSDSSLRWLGGSLRTAFL